MLGADTVDLVGSAGEELEHHGVQLYFHIGILDLLNKPGGVLRSGELLVEVVEPKAIVDALVEDAAQLLVPLQNQYLPQPLVPGLPGGGQSGGAAANDDEFIHERSLLGPWSLR